MNEGDILKGLQCQCKVKSIRRINKKEKMDNGLQPLPLREIKFEISSLPEGIFPGNKRRN